MARRRDLPGALAAVVIMVVALTLGPSLLAALGLVGCLVLAVSLPLASVLAGFRVLALGALRYAFRHR